MIKFTVGEIRPTIQPIRFAILDAPLADESGGTLLECGDWVVLQYWGQGRIVVTRMPDGVSVTALDREISGGWLTWDDMHAADPDAAINHVFRRLVGAVREVDAAGGGHHE